MLEDDERGNDKRKSRGRKGGEGEEEKRRQEKARKGF